LAGTDSRELRGSDLDVDSSFMTAPFNFYLLSKAIRFGFVTFSLSFSDQQ
jgi:hypothetical protein